MATGVIIAVCGGGGIAFTDRKDPGEDLFKDADAALYHTKENGRCGYSFYGEAATGREV